MATPPRKTALITGAGRNIGRAVALGLARDGFNLIINGSSDHAAAESVAAKAVPLDARALAAAGNVGRPADWNLSPETVCTEQHLLRQFPYEPCSPPSRPPR